MSLHIESTEEANETLRKEKRKNYIAALVTSILSAVLAGAILYSLTIIIAPPEEPDVVSYITPDEGPPSDVPPPPEVQRETASSSSHTETPVKVVVSVAAAPVSMAKIDIDPPDDPVMLEDGNIMGLGDGFGSDLGDSTSGFGSTSSTGSNLVGTFYDLKLTRGGKPSDIKIENQTGLLNFLKKFIEDGWKEQMLNGYYKAPTPLYAAQFYIPYCPAEEGPKAYGCDTTKIKPSHWVAIYRGKVRAPKSGEFRFVGYGDDILVVRFNGENVFDYGYRSASQACSTSISSGGRKWVDAMENKPGNDGLKKNLQKSDIMVPPVTFYKYSGTTAGQKNWMGVLTKELNGAAAGKKFKVEKGKVYPIEILISECGGKGAGNKFATALLIEDMDVPPVKKDSKTGAPILPLFRTNYGVPDQSKHIPFDEIGPVWESVK